MLSRQLESRKDLFSSRENVVDLGVSSQAVYSGKNISLNENCDKISKPIEKVNQMIIL